MEIKYADMLMKKLVCVFEQVRYFIVIYPNAKWEAINKRCFFDHVYIAYCAIRDAHDCKLRNDLVPWPILLIFDVQKLCVVLELIICFRKIVT